MLKLADGKCLGVEHGSDRGWRFKKQERFPLFYYIRRAMARLYKTFVALFFYFVYNTRHFYGFNRS